MNIYFISNLLLSAGSSISTWSPISKCLGLASYHNASYSISETFAFLPEPASGDPPDVHESL